MDKTKEFEEIEKEFKEKVFRIFKDQIPDTKYDEETGIIKIPRSYIREIKKKRGL